MASDLKLEIFAYNIFCETWKREFGIVGNGLNILQIFGEECLKVENYMEACDASFLVPVFYRRMAFKATYMADLTGEKIEALKSPSDCFDLIISVCDREDLFGHLTVCERIFATCAFVIQFCVTVYAYNNVDVVKYGYLFWAMYIDKFTKEFYEEGGWNTLSEIGLYYLKFYDIFAFLHENEFHILNKAIDEYYDFIYIDQYVEYKLNNMTLSILWIKYRIEEFRSCAKIPVIYQSYDQVSYADEALENLKALYAIILNENPVSPAFSDTTDEYDVYLDSLNAYEKLSSNQIDASLCCGKSPSSVPADTSSLGSETKVKQNNGKEEECSEKSSEINYSLKNENQQIECVNKDSIISVNQTAKSEFDRNSLSCISTQDALAIYPKETEVLNGTTNTSEALFKNQKDVLLGYRKSLKHSVSDATNHSSEKSVKVSVEEVSTEKFVGVKCTSNTCGNQKETMSPSHTTETTSNGKSSKEFLITKNFKTMYADNSPSKSTKSECKSSTVPKDLSKNQMDISLAYRKPPSYNIPDSENFISKECAKYSVEEISAENTFEGNCNLNNKDQQIETSKRTDISTSHIDKSNLDINSSYHVPTQQCVDNLRFKRQSCATLDYRKPPSYNILDSENFISASNTEKPLSVGNRNPSLYIVPDALDYSSEKSVRGSVEEIRIENSLGVNCTSKNDYDQDEILSRMDTVSTNRTVDTESNVKSSPDVIPEKQFMGMYIENLHSKHIQNECKILNRQEILLKNQMDSSLGNGHSPLCNVPITTDHIIEKNTNAEKQHIEKTIEVNYSSRNGDNQGKIYEKMETIPTSKMVKFKVDVKTISDSLPIPKVIDPENQCENINVEKEKNEKTQKCFKREQDDYEMKFFLRMILVLNDRHCTKFVYQALQKKKKLLRKKTLSKNNRKEEI